MYIKARAVNNIPCVQGSMEKIYKQRQGLWILVSVIAIGTAL